MKILKIYITLYHLVSNSIKFSSSLMILTQTSFWVLHVHNWFLVSHSCLLFILHISTWGPLLWFLQKRLEIATSFWIFFSTFFFKSQHYTEKNQNKCLTLQLDSCDFLHYSLIAVIILKIFWSEKVHLRTSFFTADSRREVVVQM